MRGFHFVPVRSHAYFHALCFYVAIKIFRRTKCPANRAFCRTKPISDFFSRTNVRCPAQFQGLIFLSGNWPLRPVSTQENKHRIGSDWTFSILYYPHRWTKKVESTSSLYHPGCGSNWNRKLIAKAHARVQFCSDPVRSDAYFSEWKLAFSNMFIVWFRLQTSPRQQ